MITAPKVQNYIKFHKTLVISAVRQLESWLQLLTFPPSGIKLVLFQRRLLLQLKYCYISWNFISDAEFRVAVVHCVLTGEAVMLRMSAVNSDHSQYCHWTRMQQSADKIVSRFQLFPEILSELVTGFSECSDWKCVYLFIGTYKEFKVKQFASASLIKYKRKCNFMN